jgi:hypothetical protein
LRSSERVGTGRMSESSQRVGTGRTPLALRNKETFVPGDLQCLNHRSCESVLLIPPPSGPPRPTIITTEHHSWEQTVEQTVFVSKRNKNGPNANPFCVCTSPALQRTDIYISPLFGPGAVFGFVFGSVRSGKNPKNNQN